MFIIIIIIIKPYTIIMLKLKIYAGTVTKEKDPAFGHSEDEK